MVAAHVEKAIGVESEGLVNLKVKTNRSHILNFIVDYINEL
jgi:hypothetical protein